MRVGQRLMLAVIPAILGLFTVAGLAYWGDRYRAAPAWVVTVAAVGAVVSLALAWQNVRHITRRIERLADRGNPPSGGVTDELDSIEHVVDGLSSAVVVAEAERQRREATVEERMREYADLLADATAMVTRRLDDVRLPLHILLENHFGELNENQEELLEAARSAADAVNAELQVLSGIASVDSGALTLRRERVNVGGLIHDLRPKLEAEAARLGASLDVDAAPGLIMFGDRVRLQEAMATLLGHLVRRGARDGRMRIAAESEDGHAVITIEGAAPLTAEAEVVFAQRIVSAQGGRIESDVNRVVIRLPRA